jgi:hypothetical protein
MSLDTSAYGSIIFSAATIVAIQKWLKQQEVYARFVATFPGADKWAHWLIAGLSSIIAAAGIHVTWNWDVIKGGQFAGSLPSLMDMVHGILDWFKVYIMQHTIYESTHQPPFEPPAKAPPVEQPTLRAGQPDPLQVKV